MLSLTKPEDLLDKATFSNRLMHSTFINPDYDYYLFDTIFSLNHIFDWYLKSENTLDDCICCIKRFNPYKAIDEVTKEFRYKYYRNINPFPVTNGFQNSIRQLCNKGKHFLQTDIEKEYRDVTARCGHPTMVCGGSLARLGRSMIKYKIDINGEIMLIETIINSLIDDWRKFLNNENQEI